MRQYLKDGNAYADFGTGEEMKEQRDEGIESPQRARTPEDNLKVFEQMLSGKIEDGKSWCIRGKWNM